MAREIEAALLPGMRELLEGAGFHMRSATRADCAHCTGRSHGTVSFNREVGHCFRCGWKANVVTLAREIGLLGNDPPTREQLRVEAQRRARVEGALRGFETWRESRIRAVSDHFYCVSRHAVLAHNVLLRFPDCEAGWDALARFYHAEARLSRAFDLLTFAKASAWLEFDSTPAEVFRLWRAERVAA